MKQKIRLLQIKINRALGRQPGPARRKQLDIASDANAIAAYGAGVEFTTPKTFTDLFGGAS